MLVFFGATASDPLDPINTIVWLIWYEPLCHLICTMQRRSPVGISDSIWMRWCQLPIWCFFRSRPGQWRDFKLRKKRKIFLTSIIFPFLCDVIMSWWCRDVTLSWCHEPSFNFHVMSQISKYWVRFLSLDLRTCYVCFLGTLTQLNLLDYYAITNFKLHVNNKILI